MKKLVFAGLALAALMAVNTGSSEAAASAALKACSAQWAQMKASNTVPAGQKWTDFEKTCMAQQSGAAAPAAKAAAPAAKAAAPAPAKAAAPAAPAAPAAKTTTAAAPAAAAGATAATAGTKSSLGCTMQWDMASMMHKVPAGQTKDQFLAACMAKPEAANTNTAAAPAPTEPAGAATGGKAGEVSRIQACGAEWKQMKAAGKVAAGEKWPQFWSNCDKQLKAQGL